MDDGTERAGGEALSREEQKRIGDRLPPHDDGAELGVIGCCLLDPNTCIAECVAKFGATVEVFYDERHQILFKVLAGLLDRTPKTAIDLTTVASALQDSGVYEEVGGVGYLNEAMDATPSSVNLGYYLDTVWEKYLLRRMLQVMVQSARKIFEPTEPGVSVNVPALLDGIEAEVLGVNRHTGGGQVKNMYELLAEAQERIETMRRGVGLLSGMRTHFGHLDKWTAGLHRKQMLVLAGRPGTGKTSLALCLARNLAVKERIPVGVFSMEMGAEELMMRLLCSEASVDSHKLRTGFPSAEDLQRLAKAGAVIGPAKIYIDDTPALGVLELRARARRMAAQYGVKAFVVDYLQLMHGSRDFNNNRALEVAEISGGMKAIGKELDVAMIVLSQLNRETEKNKSRKPQLADLRESGAIEQDADTVLMLYRPKSDDDEEKGEEAPISVNGLIAKQRNGPSDWDIEFAFFKKYTRFEDAYGNRGHLAVGPQPPNGGGENRGPAGAADVVPDWVIDSDK